jgi:hypothetical protein
MCIYVCMYVCMSTHTKSCTAVYRSTSHQSSPIYVARSALCDTHSCNLIHFNVYV